MLTKRRFLGILVLTSAVLFGTVRPAAAQFVGTNAYVIPPAYGPFGPGSYGQGDPYGGYGNSAADTINAMGQYLLQTAQSTLIQQQAAGAQIDNRRAAFDERQYEIDNTPTLNDIREQAQQAELRRSMNDPPVTEIWAGKSLNDMLTNLQQLEARGVTGPSVPVSPGVLKQINVTVKDVGNVGLLKDAANLKWPFALRALSDKEDAQHLRDEIGTLLVTGKKQALTGVVDADLLIQLQKDVDLIRHELKESVLDRSFSDYTASKSFVHDLDAAIKILKDPNADRYVDGSYTAQGHSVGELVAYMSQKGLRFAHSIAGEEGAYSSLHQSMLKYSIGTASTGAELSGQ